MTSEYTAVVLVEGISDKIALETLARRLGRELVRDGVAVVPIGGAQACGRALRAVASRHPRARVAGLCDAGEERDFRRALERAGLGSNLTREQMEELGFYICEADLEDELIRALGPESVERLVEEHGDLRPFRTLQKQSAWRGREPSAQLRRFMGSGGRRKIRYAQILVDALEPAAVPRPLAGLLEHV